MSVQASASAKEQVEPTWVKIGNDEWKEIQNYYQHWYDRTDEMISRYSEKKLELPEEYQEEIKRHAEFLTSVRHVHEYMCMIQPKQEEDETHEYWIANPRPGSFYVSYDGQELQRTTASFQELMGFLALGVARGCWSIDDARDHVVTKCNAKKLLAVS